MRSNTVLLAGASGMLGARIAHHLLEAEDVALRLLVRPAALAEPDKRSGLDPLVGRGAELVEGDVADPASLLRATEGVDVVVSALQVDARSSWTGRSPWPALPPPTACAGYCPRTSR